MPRRPAPRSSPEAQKQTTSGSPPLRGSDVHLPWLRALPAYLGGKRRLCRLIFALLAAEVPRARWRGLTFVDPFLGGGSVGLFAKAVGFHVLCSDIALRSAAIGRALIASSVTLGHGDIAALLSEPSGPYSRRAEERHSPGVFSKPHARLLDRARHNLCSFPEPARSLATVLVVKWALRLQPMSQLRGTDAGLPLRVILTVSAPRALVTTSGGRNC